MRFVGGVIAAMVLSHACLAQPAGVAAQDAWARATTPGVTAGGAYVTLTSPAGDRLVAVSSPAAGKASVHEMRMDGSVMRMREMPGGIDLPAGKPVVLAPGGYHIMLEELRAPLKQGSAVPLHLEFEKAPAIDVQAQVQPIGSAGPGGHGAMPGMGVPK